MLHYQTWLKYGHASAAVFDCLNRQFDVLIPALEGNNKAAARAAVGEMIKEAFGHHRGLSYQKLDEDDEIYAAEAMPQKGSAGNDARINTQPVALDRIAARALAFDLVYLLSRAERGH